MALNKDDIQRISGLLTPLHQELSSIKAEIGSVKADVASFRTEVNAQFNEVQSNFEGLFARDERREQEYLLLRGQIARLEDRVDAIGKKVA